MNENIDIDATFVPDDSASHSWAERDSELVEEYAAQLMSMSIEPEIRWGRVPSSMTGKDVAFVL